MFASTSISDQSHPSLIVCKSIEFITGSGVKINVNGKKLCVWLLPFIEHCSKYFKHNNLLILIAVNTQLLSSIY